MRTYFSRLSSVWDIGLVVGINGVPSVPAGTVRRAMSTAIRTCIQRANGVGAGERSKEKSSLEGGSN